VKLSDFLVYLCWQFPSLSRLGVIQWCIRVGRRESAKTISSMLGRLVARGRLTFKDGVYGVSEKQ
jgi:hypothetical protein